MMEKLFSLPTLYKISNAGKLSEWNVWGENNDNKYSFVVEHGYIDGKKQLKRTIIDQGKNIGKANETSVEEQVKLEAESKWRKQLDKGYSENKEVETRVIRPMLAHKFSEHSHKVLYPCFISQKLDGIRCLAQNKDGNIVLTSRLGKEFKAISHLNEFLRKVPINVILDGELYSHSIDFQSIISATKRDDSNENSSLIEYHVYDVILLDKLNATNSQRFDWLSTTISILEEQFSGKCPVKLVDCIEIHSEDEIQYYHDKFVEEGYEGAMLRNKNGIYGIDKRSHDLLKVKSFQDAEYQIIGAEKDKNEHAVFVCKNENGDTFGVKMKGTDEFRKNLWYNRELYIGKMLTVKYFNLTNDGIPRFPVGISIRNYE